jgi:hypothetical protein
LKCLYGWIAGEFEWELELSCQPARQIDRGR